MAEEELHSAPTPPSASLYRERMIYTDRAVWLSKKIIATDCLWRKAATGAMPVVID